MESEGTTSLTLSQRLRGFVSVLAVLIALTVIGIHEMAAWRGLKLYHADMKQFIGTVASAAAPYADDRDRLAKRVVELENQSWTVPEDALLETADQIRLDRASKGSRKKVNE